MTEFQGDGKPGNVAGETRPNVLISNAVNSQGLDNAQQTVGSMDAAINQYRRLVSVSEPAHQAMIDQVLTDSKKNWNRMTKGEKLISHRSMLTMELVLGQHHLEQGSTLHQAPGGKPVRILEGTNLDMGGEAFQELQAAKVSVADAAELTEKVKGSGATSGSGLNEASFQVDKSIQDILGPHDIPAAQRKLVKFLEDGGTASGTIRNPEKLFEEAFEEEIDKKLGSYIRLLQSPDGSLDHQTSTMVAKLSRDQALAKIALAEHKLNQNNPTAAASLLSESWASKWFPGTFVNKGHLNNGLGMLALAGRLDPQNPDQVQLKNLWCTLADRVGKELPNSRLANDGPKLCALDQIALPSLDALKPRPPLVVPYQSPRPLFPFGYLDGEKSKDSSNSTNIHIRIGLNHTS